MLHELFEFVMNRVWDECGDGDGVMVFAHANIQNIAVEFEKWMSSVSEETFSRYKRLDISPDYVLFSDESNENITICSKFQSEQARTPWVPAVWVEV